MLAPVTAALAPTSTSLQIHADWVAVRVPLTHSVEIQYSFNVTCPRDAECIEFDAIYNRQGQYDFTFIQVGDAMIRVSGRSDALPGQSVVVGATVPWNDLPVLPGILPAGHGEGLVGSSQKIVVGPQDWGPEVILLFMAWPYAGDLTLSVDGAPPYHVASGADVRVSNLSDFRSAGHAFVSGMVLAAPSSMEVTAEQGLLGTFLPYSGLIEDVVVDANVHSPAGDSPCRNSVELTQLDQRIVCRDFWMLAGPQGAWRFEVTGKAAVEELGDERPVLMWVDAALP